MSNGLAKSRLESLHTAALGLWLGALLAVGGIAAVAFPTMKSLAPALPGFRVPVEDHWSIAAGHIMNPAFFAVMIAGIVLCAAALLAWTCLSAARRIVLVIALLLAVGTLMGLGLPMQTHLDGYWMAAQAGELEAAAEAKTRFDALHPWSSRAMGTQAGVVALALVMAIASRRAVGKAAP
jgi:hypothetical protein